MLSWLIYFFFAICVVEVNNFNINILKFLSIFILSLFGGGNVDI